MLPNPMDLVVILPKQQKLRDDFQAVLNTAGLDYTPLSDGRTAGTLRARGNDFPVIAARLRRPGDALRAVESGIAALAVTGGDSFAEYCARARRDGRPAPLDIAAAFDTVSACRIAIATPAAGSAPQRPTDLAGLRIATSYPAILNEWLVRNGVPDVTIIPCDGDVEESVGDGIADAVCDIVRSGRTLAANNLEERFRVMDSRAVLVRRAGSVPSAPERALCARLAGQPVSIMAPDPVPA